jgi:NAD(P)-dependent dehydrogenase (short-subunit alcohol dehydrogenase family)
MSRSDFTGKIAVVTGAGNGMGRSAAMGLAAAGASVVLADIDVAAAEDAVRAITESGGRARFVRTDVSAEADVEAMVTQAVAAYGGLDLAVNAAGIEIEQDFVADADVAVFDRVIAVNLRSIFLCLKYEIRALRVRGGGSIVNFASTNAFKPQVTQSAYNASKFGVVGLTKTAALEYTRYGIRVNAVAPGAIDTAMLREAIEHRGADEAVLLKKYGLFGRFGRVDEVTQAVLFLCSEDSSFTSGHVLCVDGGLLTS